MNNIQKAFKNKAERGLRLAVGGVLPFGEDTLQQRQKVINPLQQIDSSISMGNAVDNSNLTMSEKAALGMGTTSADASALRKRTSALSTLRSSLAEQPGVREQLATLEEQQGLRLADGGIVETPEQVMARMAAKYGAAPSQPAVEAPRPAAPPVTQPAQAKGGLLDSAMRGLRGRAAQIDKAVGMAQGGVVKISGPGTGTSDDIPLGLRTDGKKIDVNVSNGEALAVLPAKTAADPQAIDAVNAVIEQTNGKPPKGLRAGGQYAGGSVFGGNIDEENATPIRPKVGAQPVSLAATPEQKASFAEKVDAFKQARGLQAWQVEPGAQERTFTPAKPVSPVVPIKEQPTQATANQAQAAAEARDAAFAREIDPEVVATAQKSPLRTGRFMAEQDATKFAVPTGSGGGVITGAPDKQGLRRAMVVLPNRSDQYVGADGKPTSDWRNTQDYKDAIARHKADKTRLAEMQRENMVSDIQSANPFYQQRGLRGLAAEKLLAEADGARGKNGASGLDLAKFELALKQHELAVDGQKNMQSNNERDAYFKDNEAHTTRVDNLLKSWASGEDGKLDNQKYAYLQKYAGQFKRGKGMSSDEHLAELMDNFAVDNLFEQQGRHWSSAEGPSAGEAVLPKKGRAGLGALLDGRMSGQDTYVDPLTKRTIYQSDVVGTLSPRQQKILQERLAKQR